MWFLLWENAARKGGPFRLAKTRATHFDKKRAWNANCVQTQSGGEEGQFRLAETRAAHFDKKRAWNANCVQTQFGGDDRDRTDDLLNAIQTRSQLRYAPISNFTYLL